MVQSRSDSIGINFIRITLHFFSYILIPTAQVFFFNFSTSLHCLMCSRLCFFIPKFQRLPEGS